MATTSISSRQFNQDPGMARKASCNGAVLITDRGIPTHVLLATDDYKRLNSSATSIVEMLAMPGIEDINFDPLRADNFSHPASLD